MFKLSVERQFIDKFRSTLATAIRKNPYNVQSLVAGFDNKGAQLYWLDYLGTCSETGFGAHGYCAYFINSVLNQYYTPVGHSTFYFSILVLRHFEPFS